MRKRLFIASAIFASMAAALWGLAVARVFDIDLVTVPGLADADAGAITTTLLAAGCAAGLMARDRVILRLADAVVASRRAVAAAQPALAATLPLRVLQEAVPRPTSGR